jgi:hypothetical protein
MFSMAFPGLALPLGFSLWFCMGDQRDGKTRYGRTRAGGGRYPVLYPARQGLHLARAGVFRYPGYDGSPCSWQGKDAVSWDGNAEKKQENNLLWLSSVSSSLKGLSFMGNTNPMG